MSNIELILAVPIGVEASLVSSFLRLVPADECPNAAGRIGDIHVYYRQTSWLKMKIVNYPKEYGLMIMMSCARPLNEMQNTLMIFLYRQMCEKHPGDYLCFDANGTTLFYAKDKILTLNNEGLGAWIRHDFQKVLPAIDC